MVGFRSVRGCFIGVSGCKGREYYNGAQGKNGCETVEKKAALFPCFGKKAAK